MLTYFKIIIIFVIMIYIYTLTDPLNNDIRYIGKTNNL